MPVLDPCPSVPNLCPSFNSSSGSCHPRPGGRGRVDRTGGRSLTDGSRGRTKRRAAPAPRSGRRALARTRIRVHLCLSVVSPLRTCWYLVGAQYVSFPGVMSFFRQESSRKNNILKVRGIMRQGRNQLRTKHQDTKTQRHTKARRLVSSPPLCGPAHGHRPRPAKPVGTAASWPGARSP